MKILLLSLGLLVMAGCTPPAPTTARPAYGEKPVKNDYEGYVCFTYRSEMECFIKPK